MVTLITRSNYRLQAARFTDAAERDQFAQPLSFETFQAQLPSDWSLVSYHIVGEEILGFVHSRGELHVARRLTRIAVIQDLLQRLNAQWDRFRAGMDFAQRHMPVLEKSTQRVLLSLYTELIAPLVDRLPPGGPLAIVPHGILHNIPFHALFDGQNYLLDRYEISYAPSATVLALCQQRSSHAPVRALIAGTGDALIPAALAEVQSVGRRLAEGSIETDILTDEAVTREAVETLAPDCEIEFHLHG